MSPDYDSGANWCGQGCGAELCVQPGTSRDALLSYLTEFRGQQAAAWLQRFSVNPF